MAVRQRAVLGDEVTYVVLDRQWRVVEPVEAYLEYLRQERYSLNTLRAYAQGLALWWSMLEDQALDWQGVDVRDLVRFKLRLRQWMHRSGSSGAPARQTCGEQQR
jgi:site-specific recombinase XerC